MKKKFVLILIFLLLMFICISANMIDSSDVLSYRIYGAIITFIIVLISWIIIWFNAFKSEEKSKPVKVNMGNLYKNLSMNTLRKYNINFDKFKEMVYKKFKDIHLGMSNGDLDLLKLNLTNDLYNYYVSELEEMSKINQKNIMSDFEFVNFKIFNILDEYNLQFDVYLNVRMFDYKLDIENNVVIFGDDTEKSDLEFELTFIKNDDTGNLYNDYVLCKKRCVNQMNILDKDKGKE